MTCAIVSPRFNDSQEVGVKDVPALRRCILLMLMAKGCSRENVGTAVKCADSKPRNARQAKGSCTVVAIMETMRAIPAMAAQIRHATSMA